MTSKCRCGHSHGRHHYEEGGACLVEAERYRRLDALGRVWYFCPCDQYQPADG